MTILKFIKHLFDYLLYYPIYLLKTKDKYNIISEEETVNLLVSKKKSLSRFGDGEFKWLLNIHQKSFQKQNEKLMMRLREILMSDNKNVIIAIPDSINYLDNHTFDSKRYWAKFYSKYLNKIRKYLNFNYAYSNANISRPYMCYKNKDENIMRHKFDNIKKIWNKKDILIVEGELTKLGVGNDLFENANSIKRIICPNCNAFDIYDDILSVTKKYGKNKVILIALGPTATVLSYDLGVDNYQAIDIGHTDIEYMWYINKSYKKVAVNGKFVNEAQTSNFVISSDMNSYHYEKQIIYKFN